MQTVYRRQTSYQPFPAVATLGERSKDASLPFYHPFLLPALTPCPCFSPAPLLPLPSRKSPLGSGKATHGSRKCVREGPVAHASSLALARSLRRRRTLRTVRDSSVRLCLFVSVFWLDCGYLLSVCLDPAVCLFVWMWLSFYLLVCLLSNFAGCLIVYLSVCCLSSCLYISLFISVSFYLLSRCMSV